jgi:hypothetical protein
LDALGGRLLEAYRQLGDVEIELISGSNQLAVNESPVRALEEEVRNHRQNCAICLALNWQKEVIRAFSKDEPAWRGTMA